MKVGPRVRHSRIGPTVRKVTPKCETFSYKPHLVAKLKHLLLMKVGGGKKARRGGIAQPRQPVELHPRKSTVPTDCARAVVLQPDFSIGWHSPHRNLAHDFARRP